MKGQASKPAHPLVSLLLGNLLNLVQQLSDAQLELCQLLFGSHLCVVHCLLTNGHVQMNSLERKMRYKEIAGVAGVSE